MGVCIAGVEGGNGIVVDQGEEEWTNALGPGMCDGVAGSMMRRNATQTEMETMARGDETLGIEGGNDIQNGVGRRGVKGDYECEVRGLQTGKRSI